MSLSGIDVPDESINAPKQGRVCLKTLTVIFPNVRRLEVADRLRRLVRVFWWDDQTLTRSATFPTIFGRRRVATQKAMPNATTGF